MLTIENILEEAADEMGWTEYTQLLILKEYLQQIANAIGSTKDFEEYISERMETEYGS